MREAERLPLISGIEIVGAHQAAVGIELDGLWQPTLTRIHVRNCLHGIHVVRRNRNLIAGTGRFRVRPLPVPQPPLRA
ncbi:MAG: hypothetical protein KJ749_02985 [Planctomycetes bacterium]|nr:hypothetical protein [Planctomycetota bacterium]